MGSNDFLKGKVDSYTIGDDTITKENLKKYLKDSKFSVSSNGVLYRTDKVGCILVFLICGSAKRVKYKNEMKKYGKSGNKEKYILPQKTIGSKDFTQFFIWCSWFNNLGFMILIMPEAQVTTIGVRQLLNQLRYGTNIKYNKELGDPELDSNIYIDTDSVFFRFTVT